MPYPHPNLRRDFSLDCFPHPKAVVHYNGGYGTLSGQALWWWLTVLILNKEFTCVDLGDCWRLA